MALCYAADVVDIINTQVNFILFILFILNNIVEYSRI